MEREIQQHKDEQQCHRNSNHEPVLRRLQVLKLPAVGHIITRRQMDFLIDFHGHFRNDTLHIPVSHVETHRDAAFGILSGNLCGTRADGHIGHHFDGNLIAIG